MTGREDSHKKMTGAFVIHFTGSQLRNRVLKSKINTVKIIAAFSGIVLNTEPYNVTRTSGQSTGGFQ